ncbi:MAG: biotin--[acetyl-CoA-carboxylase] ligase [Oscillospiraceae bacterium]|jgi:BirA family biotin operon repressor/biotin-[acetyl-CoA-carboxylase] ligase|nr:biotin--[acetyl-CoA-carboxylase] ligase [Oscillospiraceae bacterium]MDD3261569.1 biotin--[acetyl-CoA-carboxylase] ligase [Oscillospiraceae bacterium]
MQQEAALNAPAVLRGLHTNTLGKNLYCLAETGSTNEEIKRMARAGAPDGTTVTAERQTGGKGRLGRSWHSPQGGGLYFTVLLRGRHLPNPVTNAPLLAGLAVCTALRESFGTDAHIKWPNDVVIGSRKVCGILCEAGTDPSGCTWAAVGIGINVGNSAFPPELAVRATSLLLETGRTCTRCVVLQRILEKMEPLLESGSLPESYTRLCVSLGRQVSYFRGQQKKTGTACGITPAGELLVQLPGGSTEAVGSGEVTVQGIYGE